MLLFSKSPMTKKNSFRKELEKILTQDELQKLKTSFDVIGDIAILEIDEELRSKEEKIGSILLSMHKNIKTVLRKESEHRGKLRRQKMKFLAGEDKRLTIHKENNTSLYVDVEKVYFSPRLSTERKRIMQQVEKDENILVMFSGAGPYPMVLAKNTRARKITGIELNPAGHRLALENKKLNKKNNVDFLKGDVCKIIPFITKKPLIGLKSNWRKSHLEKKIKHHPELLEIYIGEGDLENHWQEFENSIEELSKKKMKIILHMPLKYKGTENTIATDDKKLIQNTKECFSLLEKTCKKYNLSGFVAHPYSFATVRGYYKRPYKHTQKNICEFLEKNNFSYLMLENLMWGPFSNPNSIIKIAKKYSINLCIDIAHLYSYSKTKEEFYNALKKFPKNTYYHIADSSFINTREKIAYETHSLSVGEGDINFDLILPLIKQGIAEVVNKDELNPREMVGSWQKLKSIAEGTRFFDRILMPLPKSAEDFLPAALKAAKKGAIIHFYDFLHEDEFYLAEEKAKRACKNAGLKYKKLDFVKCGQHSPRTFRVCLDFKVS